MSDCEVIEDISLSSKICPPDWNDYDIPRQIRIFSEAPAIFISDVRNGVIL